MAASNRLFTRFSAPRQKKSPALRGEIFRASASANRASVFRCRSKRAATLYTRTQRRFGSSSMAESAARIKESMAWSGAAGSAAGAARGVHRIARNVEATNAKCKLKTFTGSSSRSHWAPARTPGGANDAVHTPRSGRRGTVGYCPLLGFTTFYPTYRLHRFT